MDFWLILGSKIDEKSMNRSKNRSKIRCDLGSIFIGSWMGFGLDLAPSWGQVGTKIDQKSKLKKACNKDSDRELLNVKILGQSGAWELLNVKIWAKMKISFLSRGLVRGRRGV